MPRPPPTDVMRPASQDLAGITAFRRNLHRRPELSGEETETALKVVTFIRDTAPDTVLTSLGGHGVAAVFDGAGPGPTVMIRAELDGLPIRETNDFAHASMIPGKGHLCGHDGHMAILCTLARMLGRRRPARGRAVLLFQPAEETGQGAAAVLADPEFAQIRPDIALSLHNLPGLELGRVALIEGPANCASCGLTIRLSGRTAHASMPETGLSPLRALTELLAGLPALGPGGALLPGYRLATVVHARLGEPAFGVAAGEATILVTLRCLEDTDMETLRAEAGALARKIAAAENLGVNLSFTDEFSACVNAPEATDILRRACEAEGVPLLPDPEPMRWSEDFGQFGGIAKSAMFVLGAGVGHPQLHNPDYDFPDDLIPVGAGIFHRAITGILG